jgi:hypothetical protein
MVVPRICRDEEASHRMHVKSNHREEKLLEEAIDEVSLDEQMRSYFKRRYLEYLRWLEDGSATNLVLYYALRIPAIVLAALVPALVALDLGTVGRTITVILGVAVAATTTVEHFLGSGQRWRHYRGSVELMKSEGWLYLQLAGSYASYPTLEAAFPDFVARVEMLMRDEVREYVTTIVAERQASPTAPSADEERRGPRSSATHSAAPSSASDDVDAHSDSSSDSSS